jgi:hypothetical protein
LIAAGVAGGLLLLLLVVGAIAGRDQQAGEPEPTSATTQPSDRTQPTEPATTAPGPSVPEPGSEGLNGLIVTEIPFALGDNEELDVLARDCAVGDLAACDGLYDESPVNTLYEDYGGTCGDRVEFDRVTPCTINEELLPG